MNRKKWLIPIVCFAAMMMTGTSAWPDVISAGGQVLTSPDGSYTLKFSLGQSTPVSDPLTPPPDDGGKLRPGFWYTTADGCEVDTDADGDVDGKDISAFAAAFAADGSLVEKLGVLARSFAGNPCE